MKGLSREFCEKIALARREAGISQIELAAEIGCKQSALSPFERGDGTKLSDEAIKKLSEKFGIPLPSKEEEKNQNSSLITLTSSFPAFTGLCLNPDCPSHRKVMAGPRAIVIPDRKVTDPIGGRYCAFCGEVLVRTCPNCGAAVHDGAVCSICGKPYIS